MPSDASTMGEQVVARLHAAMNARDVDAFVACFAEDYDSAQPATPTGPFAGASRFARIGRRSSPRCPTSEPNSSASTRSAIRRGPSALGGDAGRRRATRHGGRDRVRRARGPSRVGASLCRARRASGRRHPRGGARHDGRALIAVALSLPVHSGTAALVWRSRRRPSPFAQRASPSSASTLAPDHERTSRVRLARARMGRHPGASYADAGLSLRLEEASASRSLSHALGVRPEQACRARKRRRSLVRQERSLGCDRGPCRDCRAGGARARASVPR